MNDIISFKNVSDNRDVTFICIEPYKVIDKKREKKLKEIKEINQIDNDTFVMSFYNIIKVIGNPDENCDRYFGCLFCKC